MYLILHAVRRKRIVGFPLPQISPFPMLAHEMAERPVSTLNKPDVALELTLRPSLNCRIKLPFG
jgi:hypothetical protein